LFSIAFFGDDMSRP